jgi:hypothetical protein
MSKLIPILLAGFGFSTGVLGQDQDLPPFEQVDANRDGVIAVDEAAAIEELELDFRTADANQDGVIDRAEYRALS